MRLHKSRQWWACPFHNKFYTQICRLLSYSAWVKWKTATLDRPSNNLCLSNRFPSKVRVASLLAVLSPTMLLEFRLFLCSVEHSHKFVWSQKHFSTLWPSNMNCGMKSLLYSDAVIRFYFISRISLCPYGWRKGPSSGYFVNYFML